MQAPITFFFIPTQPYVSFGGISFATISTGYYNLFYQPGYAVIASSVDGIGYASSGTVGLLSVSAVPEPAASTMLIAGFGLIGLAMRRRVEMKGQSAYA